MLLFTEFAGMASLLAALGIYGVIASSVTLRTHEIGVPMALGAQTDVLRLMVQQGMILAVIGVGVTGALGVTRLMASLLFGVRPDDPMTFFAISVLVIAVSLVACYIPARRAARESACRPRRT